MKIAIAGDHAGFELKQLLVSRLREEGHDIMDLGAHDEKASDYPDFARVIGKALNGGEAIKGILVCGSGIGASVAANKIKGLRAGICHDCYSAHQGVEHDDMNVLCLGSRVIGPELALDVARAFLRSRFSGKERHQRRLGKIRDIEEKQG
jgi:ribose 5-phosphate isomerase B